MPICKLTLAVAWICTLGGLAYLMTQPITVYKMYRGFMIDCSSQFFDVYVITRIINELSNNGYTHLHIGLSNNERFRYLSTFDNRQLATVDGNREYFTKEDIEYIVQYGYDRNIIVFGEIEFISHVGIWKKVYPDILHQSIKDEFDMDNDNTYTVLSQALHEIIPLFKTSNVWHMSNKESLQPVFEIAKSLSFSLGMARIHDKTAIIWDDSIIQYNIDDSLLYEIHKNVYRNFRKQHMNDFIIQVRHNNVMNYMLKNKYRIIVSENDYWNIGSSEYVLTYDVSKLKNAKNIYGVELVWIANITYNVNNIDFIYTYIRDASHKMNEIESIIKR